MVQVNRPAYLYVVWIDAQGEVGAVHPWIAGDWKQRQVEKPVRELSLPADRADGVYRIDPGPAGMETLLLMVRETPLPEEENLAGLLAGLRTQTPSNVKELGEIAWFDNGRLVASEKTRAANLQHLGVSSSPILRMQEELGKRLAGRFAYTRAVTFGNLGGP